MAKTTEELLKDALVLIEKQSQEIKLLKEQIAFMNRRMFGRRSEQVDPNQLSLLDDSGVFTDPEQTGNQSEEEEITAVPRKVRRRRAEFFSKDLPVHVTVIEDNNLRLIGEYK